MNLPNPITYVPSPKSESEPKKHVPYKAFSIQIQKIDFFPNPTVAL